MLRGKDCARRWTALAAAVALTLCSVLAQDKKDCRDGAFYCSDNSGCVDSSMVQDGVPDCPDASDEGCLPLQFRCPCLVNVEGRRGPRCIGAEMLRDGVEDCADGADERPEGDTPSECPLENQVERWKRKASEVSTRIDGPVTTSMFGGGTRRVRPTGILTSTAGTFVLDGTTTEFATKVYGTHLDDGVYAKIVSTSSRVFFAVPSAGRIRPTGLLSSATSTRVAGTQTTYYTTEFSGTYIDGTYAQLVSSTSRVVVEPTATMQTAAAPEDDQVVTVTGTRGALIDGSETKYDVFTGTHVKGDKTYQFFFGNTAVSATAVSKEVGGTTLNPEEQLVVRTGENNRIVVSVDDRELNLVLPESAKASAAESESMNNDSGMKGVFIEGSLGGFSILGASEEQVSNSAQTEMLTVTVGRGVAQTKIVRGRYDGLESLAPSKSTSPSQSEKTVYRFAPRIPALRPPRPGGVSQAEAAKQSKEDERTEEDENLLKARKVEAETEKNPLIRPSKVHRVNLPTFTVGQDGIREDEGKVVVRVDQNVEARVGPRKDYRTLSNRQRLGKSLPFRGFQVIHEKEDLVNAESGGSLPVPTITYFGFAEFTTTAHGTVIVFQPRTKEAAASTASYSPKVTAVSAYRQSSSAIQDSKDGRSSESSKQKVATGVKTFYSHTPGMVTRTVTGHSLSMQTTLPTILVEPVVGLSVNGREKSGRKDDDAELVYPTSDAPEEIYEEEELGQTQSTTESQTSSTTFTENAHGRPFSVDLESSILPMESSQVGPQSDQVFSSTVPTEPLHSSGVTESTESLPVGIIRSIEGTRALDGTTTFFTSLIYGTYIDGNYKKIIQTTSSVFKPGESSDIPTTLPSVDETITTEEVTTEFSEPTIGDTPEGTYVTKDMVEETTLPSISTEDDVMSTIPESTTEENDLTNEVETGRKVNNTPEEQNIISDDADKEMISALGKGAPSLSVDEQETSYIYSVIPTTVYQTYTYFTTFYIPSDGTTSTSIRSREVIASDVSLVTVRQIVPTATAETTTQSQGPTTPISVEETPELPNIETTTIETPITTTSPIRDESVEDEGDEQSEEIELIFKTLYTTYTYLTTFFHDTTTSVSSREVVITNVLTSTLNSVTLATEPALAGLVRDYDSSSSVTTPSSSVEEQDEEDDDSVPTSVGIGRPTTQFFSEDTLSSTPTAPLLITPTISNEKPNSVIPKGAFRTFYTTYTYFTTVFVDGETELTSRTEVYTNIIPPSGYIEPTSTAESSKKESIATLVPSIQAEAELESQVRPSISISHPERYSSTIMHRSGSKKVEEVTTSDVTTELNTEIRPIEQDSISISSENHEEKEKPTLEDVHETVSVTDTTPKTEITVSSSKSSEDGTAKATTEKYFGVTKFEEVGEPEKLVSEEDDQESSESNTEVVLPLPLPSPTATQLPETSILVQTTFTTFTYFTTLYRGGTSEVVSRLETVTNIMTVTVDPTSILNDKILSTDAISIKPTLTEPVQELETTGVDESIYPITYFTTFTYWTTAYKGGSTIVNSREETVSNVVTPTGRPPITREIEHILATPSTEPSSTTTLEASKEIVTAKSLPESTTISPSVVSTPPLTTFYTTYTYFTTSYVGDSTIVNSRLETVTNVEAGDTQTARAIGTSPPSVQQIITPTSVASLSTGLLSTIRTSSVGEDKRTTLYSTDVYGTYIDGLYAKVLESSTKVLEEPVISTTSELPKVNLQPTGIVSLNAGSIVDADGTATTYYSTMAIGTFIGNLYAQVVESTSSIVLNTAKTDVPLSSESQRTGLVRLIKGSIVKGESTTFYESRVVGTVIDGRYAQIIESTSSFGSAEATITPTSTTSVIVTPTAAPELESSLGEVSSKEEEKSEEEEEHSQEEDEDDANNANKGRITSRLTFSSRRKTFTPVIRPFSSRNRPTFHPRRRPTSATTITRVTQTPTVTATPAHTDYLAATAARGRFSSRRGGASADVRASAVGGGRRFSRIRGSSSPGVYGSSSYLGGGRGRGTSSRISPTAASSLPFANSRSRPGGFRSSFVGRTSSEYPYGRTSSSAALFAANSRFRIRPSSTLTQLRTSAISSPPPFDHNTVEDEDEENEGEEEDDVGTEKEEGSRATEPTESNLPESAFTPTTEGTTSPLRRPLLRLRRPNTYQPPSPPSTTPSPLPRSTAARRLSLLRRPSSEENLPTEDRKQSRQRYKTSTTSATKAAKAPTTPRPRPPPRLQVLNRPRPTSSLFPRRGLFRRPGEEQEKPLEETKDEELEEDSEIVEEAESSANDATDDDDSYNLDETVADNDYEASEDVKRRNDAPQVFIRPFSSRRRRLKRQAEYGSRGTSSSSGGLRGYSNRFRRPGGSRKTASAPEAESRVGIEEEETYVEEEVASQRPNEASRQSNSRSRNSGQQQQSRGRPSTPQSRSQYSNTGTRPKNTETNTNTNNYRETSNSRTNFRRPSTPVRRRNKSESNTNTQQQQQQQRPKPPRLRTQSDTHTSTPSKPRSRSRYSNRGRSQTSSTSANTGRGRYRTSDLESNDYTTRRQHHSSWDGRVTVTLQVPMEATIPVINGKNTEYRRVVTASPSIQVLTPGQYEATEIAGTPGLLLLGRDVTATPTPGLIHVTQYVARETPTTSVEFTPTVIRGRKTSFSHVVPSTAYGVEEVVSTLPSESGLLPSSPLANILLSQLLLGQFGLQGNVNPLLGLQQPNAAALAPPTPTTEFKTRSTTFVTTLTDKTSTVIPITLRGKAILTTIVDSSIQVVTATEFITDTIVVTPTAAPQQQLNSLLLPALLQAQLLNQQQQQPTLNQNIPGALTNLQAAQILQQQQGVIRPDHLDIDPKDLIQEEEYVDNASPVVERRRQPSSSRRRNRPHKRVESVGDEEESRSTHLTPEENPRPKTRKKQPSANRKQNPPAEPQFETSVITLYVSGRRPGDFSTVLSTISVETGGSSLVKREAVFPEKPYSVQKVTESPSLQYFTSHKSYEFDNPLPQKDPNILISPSMLNYVQSLEVDKHYIKDFIQETESLESIVGDVSKHVIYQSSSIPSLQLSSHASTTPISTEKGASTTSNSPKTGHFLANGPAESAPLKRKVLMFNEGDEEESEDFPYRIKRDEREVENRKNESIEHQNRVKRDKEDDEDSVRPQRRRRVRVRVPVRRQPEDNEERDEGEIKNPVREEPDVNVPNGSRKRIRVKVLRKPSSEANDILPSEVKNQEASQVRSGRRRVIVTKKRPLTSSQLSESVLPESILAEIKPTETTGRHRIVVTRRRPIQRQSPKIAPTPSIQIQKELKTDVQQDIIEDVPSARKIPQGVQNEGFGSRKQVESEKEFVKYTSKATTLGVKIPEESLRVQENLKEVPDWVPSKTSVPIIKSTEVPSIWSSEGSIEAGQSSLHEDETSGPRIVRPTRFSVTRRPSGEFLQKVQSLRTKAPIVFPSRRRPPASTRQSAYRSRLSRLRGRPSSTSETAAVSSEDLSTQSLVTSIIPTEAPVLTPTTTLTLTPTSTFVPIFTTEVVTETLWKTYTYVVSRVESSAEAGVDEAAPPSLAAVSSSTEVKQVLKTQTVTRLVSPTAVSSSVSADGSTGIFNDTNNEDIDFDGRAIGSRINLEAGRFNLATRVMSNGVEVIVAGDKTTLPGGPDVLRILSTASRPITLAPSTLSDQMQLTLPTALGMPLGDPESLLLSLQSQAANFVTKTYATTYTYLTTFLKGSSTVVSSREDVITNVVTEELRPTKTMQQHSITTIDTNNALTSKVDGPPSFVTSTYKTTFTYLNTIIDGEVPVVLTTRQTVANTVTAPAVPSKVSGSTAEGSDHLQPSEPSLYDTNTYFNTFTLTKTLSDSASGVKVVSTEDVLTQVVITEASTSATTKPSLKISPTSTSSIVKTYFVTYTYYNTFLEKGSTVVKTNIATSSDVVTEKFYLAPTRTQPLNKTPSLQSTPSLNTDNEKTTTSLASQQPLSVFATKTYMTTFTYFTTLLENDRTITRSSVSVSTNLATEAITAGLDSVYLDSLRSSFSQQTANAPIVATVMLSGTPMEITAFQGSMLDKSGSKIKSSTSTISTSESTITNVSPSTPSNVIVGSTIIFFDDIKAEKPQDSNESSGTTVLNSESETNIHEIKDEEITPPSSPTTTLTDGPEFFLNGLHTSTPADGTISAENVVTSPDKSYITSTITASTVIASGNGLATTLIPGDAVIVSMGSDGNVSLIPVSDPSNKHPDGALIGTGVAESAAGGGGLLAAASGGPNIGDLINLGSLSLNGLNALGPVFNAMAGLIQSNLKTSPSRRNDTTTPKPPTTPHTPPPISLPRPPAPQSAPLIRDPVYIPVGGLASINSENIDSIAAESSHGESIESYFGQAFPIHGFPDTEARRPPPSPVKPSMPTTLTLDNPLLLQNGIPIQPGQVITTNSDVIVGKPSVLGPRPSPHGAIPQIFPQNHPPLPPIQHPPSPAYVANHQLPSIYPPKQSIATPPRVRPTNDVPPEMKPPPPPRFPSYTGVNPTRVSVLSGVETVFIGKPLPPHMIPENNPAPTHIIPQLPNHPSGPIRPNHPSPPIPPPIVVGLPLDNLNPRPAGLHNYNTIDRSTGYKIHPSQPLNTHVDAVTVSVGSETKVHNNPGSVFDVNIQTPTGSRPGSVLNEGEPHSGTHLSLGQAQVHNVPVGTSGEVVVEIGRPPVTDILKQPFGEETKIITNENSSEENKGVVHEEGDILIKEEPSIIHSGNTDKNNHASNIVIGHGRPQHQLPDQPYQQNYYAPGRPNSPYGNIFPFPNPHHQPPNRRPPPNLYVHSIPSQPSLVDHLMPPPLPQTTPSTKIEVLHNNNQPILIPINHGSEDSSQGNDYHKIHPTISNNIHHQLITDSDDYLEEPEDVEGAQDGEVLQESNNHPVRPQKHPSGGHQQLDIISNHPDFLKNKEATFGTTFQQSKPVINSQQSTLISDINNSKLSDDFEIMNKWNASLNVTTPKPMKNNILPEAPPYPFEIPDMSPPPPPPPKPTQPHRVPINVQRPPPGAVNRPPIRPQDYNPDFIDKPVRVQSRPLPSIIPSEGSSAQDNAVKPETPRQPVRVVVRPVSPRPRPPYHNHHIPQSRPSQITNWPRPLRPIKPPGPIQPVRQSPSQSSAWQPSFSTTPLKDIIHSSTASHLGIKPTIVSRFDSSKGSTSEIHHLGNTFSSEREPLVVIPSPSSPEIFVESSGESVLWDGEHFNSIPTVELPPPIQSSTNKHLQDSTLLLSGTSTIFGGLYSRPISSKSSESTQQISDLFLSPSSHGAIGNNKGEHIYEDEDEELENEFEEGEGLGAAGSNDAATSIVVVSVTSTPTTRYVTRTETETHTVTQTVVESRPGSPPHTRTVIVTRTIPAEMARPVTIVSTIVGTVTEVHTTVHSSTTTAVTTVTVTAPTPWPTHTMGSYVIGHNSKDTSSGLQHSDENNMIGSISPGNNLLQNSQFDTNDFASTTSNGNTHTKEKDISLIVNEAGLEEDKTSDLKENENTDEEYTTNPISTHDIENKEQEPLCKPECDATRNEICMKEVTEEEMNVGISGPRCLCRPGFARLFPDRPCMPTYTYQLRLLLDRIGKHRLIYHPNLQDPQTEEFHELQEATQDGLERVAMQSDIRDLFHGIAIAGFDPLPEDTDDLKDGKKELQSEDDDSSQLGDDLESIKANGRSQDGVIVNFYVKLSDNIDEEKLKDMFERTLKQTNYSVGGTDLHARRQPGLLEIYDFDECSNPDFNDCSDQAQCFNLHGTYTCSCKEGYADLSENSEFPGRICSAEVLGCETCKYHGQCYTDTNGKVGCKCFHWYTGDNCQINLKVLLIALVTVGAILIILVFICIMLACMKRKKPDIRHAAPGFMRYRGPTGIARGGSTMDKTAMIPDTSSESSFDGGLPPPPLAYVPLVHHRLSTSTQGSKLKSEVSERREKMHPAPPPINTGFNEQDRSLTVMIPRAKYRPAPPLLNTAVSGSQSPMTSFGVVHLEGDNRERRMSVPNEQKLLAYLDGNDPQRHGSTPTKQKQIGPVVTSHETSGNSKKVSSSRKPSTGALVSAGFEVSATVVKDKWPPETGNGNEIEEFTDEASAAGIEGHMHHTLASNGSHFTTLRTGDRTVSEARSYDETIVHLPKKSLLQSGLSGCGSKPSSQHGLHHSNDEAHTMAERDVGSTFVMPQTQLYKPSRGSDNSNFDSL